jgi:hydroxyacylglutathione hydrolase
LLYKTATNATPAHCVKATPQPEQEASILKAVIIPVTTFQQNCSVLWCEETMKAAVVDPGGDIELIEAAIAEQEVSVEKILITHGHLDHAGGAADLAANLGVPIEGPHRQDQFLLEKMTEQGTMFGVSGGKPFTPDRWLDQGDKVSIGNLFFEVHFCPGHTPGHIIYFEAGSQIAFVGDVIFQGSIGRTDLPGGDHNTLIASIREQVFPLGDGVTFVPGHGPASTIGHERQTNPYLTEG